jgi:glycine cleavage system H protein
MSTPIPDDVKHAKTHEWVRLRDGLATIGISDHAQHELSDVVFVELPAVGRLLKAGESCAVVESVKTASDVYAPISGTVTAVNPELAQHPELVNSDPYGKGWFLQIKPGNLAELDALLSAADYAREIGE